MAEPVKYKRQLRNFLIHKPLQREYTLLMIGMMMASVLIVVLIIHTTMKQALLGNPYRVGSVSPYEILSDISQQLVTRVGIALLFCIIAATLIGIVFLHRVAGPLYRFRMLLRKITSGHIPEDIRLREKDYFKEVALEFNNLFKSLRQKKMLASELLAVLDKLPSDTLPPSIRDTFNKVKETLEEF